MFGPQLESVLGHLRFGLLYLLAGLGGSIASFWFSDPNVVSVGASGAIFGLMGAYIVIMHRLGNDTRQVIGLIGINLVLGFVISGVDWRAHIGGLVTGALVAAIMAYAPARNRVLWQVIGVLGVFVLLIALTLVRDEALLAQFPGVVR
jgi:membrane associated rhomboid family serine protease